MNKLSASSQNLGFTLIEMMVVVVIAAILAAIAIPSYQEYARRSRAAQAEQEMQRLAVLLDRWKARNFNYKGFATTSETVGSTSSYPYTITVTDLSADSSGSVLLTSDDAVGRSWAIKATTTDAKSYNFLLTSTGMHCKNKTSFDSYSSCGSSGSESW
ncbi:type IV pilin protein [Acinetobacter sp. MB5]|uniref:type IV pilin protein n=1 Tax=Acinetobacter sp. MB5 TaxID=2069438 RepID=UPI000DCFA887|nr:type IV pilin protein [Acinetobacter sp. MB5]